jgi:hypothetical protein
VRVRHTQDLGGISYFDTEMLQLDIQGGALPPGARLRESPTLPSLGKTTIQPLSPTGPFQIGSFFDVFTELSFDDGAIWTPADLDGDG